MVNISQKNKLDYLLLMEDYQKSYTNTIYKDSRIASLSYDPCTKELFSQFIYYGDAYINALASQGFTAKQIIPTCKPLQYKWATENGMWIPPSWASKRPFNWYWNRRLKKNPETWALEEIITEQIKTMNPRFVWVFSGVPVSKKTLERWRPYTERIILWWACPLVRGFPYSDFDLILSGIPTLVKYFQIRGINAAYMPHAFDNRIIQNVSPATKKIPRVAFVGSLSDNHVDRIVFLDALSRQVEVDFYGTNPSFLSNESPLRKRYNHPAWGKDLYSVYGSYLLVIHKNINIAGNYASAKRLFEATGMGACVVTETADNERELFKQDEEIVTYSSLEECVDKIKYLLDNPQKAMEIAKKGQNRTLTQHDYKHRVQELLHHMTHLGFL